MSNNSTVSLLAPFMKGHRFQRKGNQFVRIEHDVAYCIGFNVTPGPMVYCTIYIIPLYMPANFIYFTYGNRIEGITKRRIKPFYKSFSQIDEDTWVQDVESELLSTVFPFFDHISQPENLLHYLQQETTPDNIIWCSPLNRMRLRIYTKLFRNISDCMDMDLQIAKMYLADEQCFDYLKERLLKELLLLEQLSRSSRQEVDAYFQQVIQSSLGNTFPKYKFQ